MRLADRGWSVTLAIGGEYLMVHGKKTAKDAAIKALEVLAEHE